MKSLVSHCHNEKAPLTVPVIEAKRGSQSFPKEDAVSIGSFPPESQVLLQAALDYAARDIPVFPCKPSTPNAKQPLVKNGFKAASTDPQQIRAWWAQWPDAMIGIPTGATSGFWVLDIDAAKAPGEPSGFSTYVALLQQHNETPADHASQCTPSGGQHILFKYTTPIKNSAGKIGPKIDVRGDGGYIIIAPSHIHGVGSYTASNGFLDNIPDAPDWLTRLATEPSQKKARTVPTPAHTPPAYGQKALDSECSALAATPRGQQNEELSRSAWRMGNLVAGGHLSYDAARAALLNAIQGWEQLDLRKITDTIDRQLKEGMTHPRGPEPEPLKGGGSPAQAAPKSKPLPTEDSLASAFTTRYAGKFLFCYDTGAWFHWDGVRWKKDRPQYSLQLMRELCRELNEDGKPVLGKLVTSTGALKFARGEMNTSSEIWDADPWLIGTPGGVVDLRTGALSPGLPDQHITKLSGVAPADTADCPLWYQFLDDATDGDQELQRFMRQMTGYCLSGLTREHALFFIYGPGGNGKSVFLNILNTILADYATTSALTTFTASNSDQHPTDLAMLRGARLVSVSETEDGRAWAESRIKQLTGGDKITARFMRQDFFEYMPQFKLLIVGNHQPTLRNVDDAARRRFNIIPFVHKPVRPDPDLEKKLKAELPAIFRWAIDGCLDWQEHGLVRPESVIAATQDYFDSQDLFSRWIEECCERGPKDWTATKALYESWAVYAKGNGEDPGDVRKFGPMLSKAGLMPDKRGNARGWKGIRLPRKEEWQDRYDQ